MESKSVTGGFIGSKKHRIIALEKNFLIQTPAWNGFHVRNHSTLGLAGTSEV